MSGDKAQLMLLVENVIYNQETHTNNGEAHEWMPLLFITRTHAYINESEPFGARFSFSVLISRVALKQKKTICSQGWKEYI